MNQNPIVKVEMSSYCNLKGVLFTVDSVQDITDVVVYSRHSVEPFFYGS